MNKKSCMSVVNNLVFSIAQSFQSCCDVQDTQTFYLKFSIRQSRGSDRCPSEGPLGARPAWAHHLDSYSHFLNACSRSVVGKNRGDVFHTLPKWLRRSPPAAFRSAPAAFRSTAAAFRSTPCGCKRVRLGYASWPAISVSASRIAASAANPSAFKLSRPPGLLPIAILHHASRFWF